MHMVGGAFEEIVRSLLQSEQLALIRLSATLLTSSIPVDLLLLF